MSRVYKNSTELMQVHGVPIYMQDMVDACLVGRLNLFLQGDTGSGKTQLARDAMTYFGDKSMFILGRNDMDTRELFQQINLEKLRTSQTSNDLKELTDKVNYHLIVVDEMPNCVPAVRAQLFNLFDGFIEVNGRAYPIGQGYSVGIATGNIGQKFTESSNDLGRALKDRMHVIVDTDYFSPSAGDTLEILAGNTNPRVEFTQTGQADFQKIIDKYKAVVTRGVPLEKLFIANYLLHGLDYCSKGSKRKMKDAWPTQLENHEQGSDVGLVLPVSPRAAKSIIRLSQSLDQVAVDKGVKNETVESGAFDSMMQAYKFVSAYSGVLNDASVEANYGGDRYKAIDAVIATTRQQFYGEKNNSGMNEKINAGLEMVSSGKLDQRVLNLFSGRWEFMRPTLEQMLKSNTKPEA
jgi:MoxR-like ATPase